MRIIRSGTKYSVYDNGIETYDQLPVGTYAVGYNQNEGCYLIRRANIEVTEKTYGVHNQKVEKVMNAYRGFERSLGVILSGDKGIGKTVADALKNLKLATPAVIYLDTAQFLLVGKNADEAVEQLRPFFRKSVEVYSFRGETDLEVVSKYLSVHGNGPKLKDWNFGEKLPVLVCSGEQIMRAKNN